MIQDLKIPVPVPVPKRLSLKRSGRANVQLKVWLTKSHRGYIDVINAVCEKLLGQEVSHSLIVRRALQLYAAHCFRLATKGKTREAVNEEARLIKMHR